MRPRRPQNRPYNSLAPSGASWDATRRFLGGRFLGLGPASTKSTSTTPGYKNKIDTLALYTPDKTPASPPTPPRARAIDYMQEDADLQVPDQVPYQVPDRRVHPITPGGVQKNAAPAVAPVGHTNLEDVDPDLAHDAREPHLDDNKTEVCVRAEGARVTSRWPGNTPQPARPAPHHI